MISGKSEEGFLSFMVLHLSLNRLQQGAAKSKLSGKQCNAVFQDTIGQHGDNGYNQSERSSNQSLADTGGNGKGLTSTEVKYLEGADHAAVTDVIYEATDITGVEAGTTTSVDGEADNNFVRNLHANMEILWLQPADLAALGDKNMVIAQRLHQEEMKKAKKTVPIVKNPAVKPKLIESTPVPYPSEAGGATGTVVVCMLIDFEGRPEYCSLYQSSGNRLLDAAAVEHCISWRFKPAKDAQGRTARCLVYIPVAVGK